MALKVQKEFKGRRKAHQLDRHLGASISKAKIYEQIFLKDKVKSKEISVTVISFLKSGSVN